jgi:hypothetical protein
MQDSSELGLMVNPDPRDLGLTVMPNSRAVGLGPCPDPHLGLTPNMIARPKALEPDIGVRPK